VKNVHIYLITHVYAPKKFEIKIKNIIEIEEIKNDIKREEILYCFHKIINL